jgi:hypothetical protein
LLRLLGFYKVLTGDDHSFQQPSTPSPPPLCDSDGDLLVAVHRSIATKYRGGNCVLSLNNAKLSAQFLPRGSFHAACGTSTKPGSFNIASSASAYPPMIHALGLPMSDELSS